MSINTPHKSQNAAYFITFTCTRYLPLIAETNSYDLIYKWFNYLRTINYFITAFVIMPNHIHATLRTPENCDLNKVLSNGKRFIAYGIVERLTKSGKQSLLTILREEVSLSDSKRGKKHQVFKRSFDAREIISSEMFFTKLTYMHNNPVKGKWMHAADPLNYPHSSAALYASGTGHSHFQIHDFRDS